jgi:hypothetical protein
LHDHNDDDSGIHDHYHHDAADERLARSDDQ